MNDHERTVTLLTCSGISHTGQLTTYAANDLRQRYPWMITRHIQLTTLSRSLKEEVEGEDCLVIVDGCEECCAKKRMDALEIDPVLYIVATREGITKRGMEEVRYDEIAALSRVIARKIQE
jgi:uncharacterized metal-binding protein